MLEVVLIVYFMCASVVGLYSTPRLKWLLPVLHDTSMTKVHVNDTNNESNAYKDSCFVDV